MLSEQLINGMHMIGRITFPLYAFLLVEGFRHTRDWRKYALRLFGLGLLSQIPYAFTINGWVGFSEMPWWRRVTDLNILFTLMLGVLMLAFLRSKRLEKAFSSWGTAGVMALLAALFYVSTVYDVAIALGAATLMVLVAQFVPQLRYAASQAARLASFGFLLFWILRRNIPMPNGGSFHFSFDYGIYAFVLFAALYWAGTPRRSAVVVALWGLWIFFGDWVWILFVGIAAVCIAFYNGQKGKNDHRLFYWAYPGHLLLLWGLLALLT